MATAAHRGPGGRVGAAALVGVDSLTSTKPCPTSGHELWAIILPSAQPAGPAFTATYQIRTSWFSGTACAYL